jgi:hypothetical protein
MRNSGWPSASWRPPPDPEFEDEVANAANGMKETSTEPCSHDGIGEDVFVECL